ncbi:hypothetical protein EDB80DRAFT_272929 [Ilyonectria destructans]|nr:hypothetical protein EDB80DRAFT_272929 [Ilyonectria destructans]
MSFSVYILVYTSRLFPAHWALWIPSRRDPAIGKRVHATGDARVGFEVEFDRNYNIEQTSRQHQLVHLAQVQDTFISDASCISGPLSSERQPCDKIEEVALSLPPPGPSLVASSSDVSSFLGRLWPAGNSKITLKIRSLDVESRLRIVKPGSKTW